MVKYKHYTPCYVCKEVKLGFEEVGMPYSKYIGEGHNTFLGHDVRVCTNCWLEIKRRSFASLPKMAPRKCGFTKNKFDLKQVPNYVKKEKSPPREKTKVRKRHKTKKAKKTKA